MKNRSTILSVRTLPSIFFLMIFPLISTVSFAQNWLLSGNASTTSSNFIGTTDAQPLIFRSNNTERLRLTSGGNLLFGKTTDDGKKLQVVGDVRIQTSAAEGFVIGNTSSAAHLVYNGQTATTSIAMLISRNLSTSSNGATIFTGTDDGSSNDQVLFKSGAHVVGFQQPFKIVRAFPQDRSSLLVDDGGPVGVYPTDYKIAVFNLNGSSKAYIDKDGGAQFSGSMLVGGSTFQSSAKMEVSSTTQGFLPPRMSTTQKTAISSPATGLLVYDNTLNAYSFYNGTAWDAIGSGGAQQWTPSGSDISYSTGAVGIGTASVPSSYKLAVAGNIIAEKVRIKLQSSGWPDYVFEPDYRLPSLKEVEQYIRQYKRLPDVPSAKEVDEQGIDVGDNQAMLLKKIEELTLHLIEQNKRMEKLEQENKEVKSKLERLENKN